jgi:hypothetical protein
VSAAVNPTEAIRQAEWRLDLARSLALGALISLCDTATQAGLAPVNMASPALAQFRREQYERIVADLKAAQADRDSVIATARAIAA